MQKLKMHSPNLTQENIARIRELFPSCVTEAQGSNGKLTLAVDFDQLRQELSESIVEGPQERYRLDWPGKREAMLAANAPIAKTLRPCREESVEFDSTKNLYIEGDNLDALKLLQETYLGKVKMIYIDPPYNTGNDFIYNDDFAETSEDFLQRSNQKDETGNRLVANTESNGRFHSDWLTMMYSRLRLARNLLRDDGVVFISIDNHEVYNLRKICDEVFGEENFLACISVASNPRGRQSDTYFATVNDYLLVYSKQLDECFMHGLPLSEDQKDDYKFDDKDGESYRLLGLRQRGSASRREDRPDMYFPVYVDLKTNVVSLEPTNDCAAVLPQKSDGSDGRWMWGKEKCVNEVGRLVAKLITRRNEYDIFVKDYLNRASGERTRKAKTIWNDKFCNNQTGTQEVKQLLQGDVMSYPKSKDLLINICRLASDTNNSDIILDFFSGSATTAHAVMQLNAEDGGNRQFIMVQLPEETPEDSPARKAGFATIAEIGKERIRRAGQKILAGECHQDWNKDVGFRVLKVDSSNMAEVYYAPDATTQAQLSLFTDNIKPDRKPEDLLFQVLLDWGVDITLPIERRTIQGKNVFFVAHNALVACFDQGVNAELVKALAGHTPLRVVFRDSGFVDDATRINVEQIFKQLSPATEVKVL